MNLHPRNPDFYVNLAYFGLIFLVCAIAGYRGAVSHWFAVFAAVPVALLLVAGAGMFFHELWTERRRR